MPTNCNCSRNYFLAAHPHFDEATSDLDSSSEALVEASIQRVSQNRTTIIIAHKLSLVQRADHIYMFSRGQVAESGNHAALLAQDDKYARICYGQGHTEALDSQDSDSLPETQQMDSSLDEKRHNSEIIVKEVQEPSIRSPTLKILCQFVNKTKCLRYTMVTSLIFCVLASRVFPVQAVIFGNAVSVFRLPGDTISRPANFWALMCFSSLVWLPVLSILDLAL
jgi:ATP-binding cassette, subfamily B (MDR/TAP), member 1